MQYKITDIVLQAGHLVVTVQHFAPDGSNWFLENYVWQGREGLKQKRAVNAQGQLLQDDGTVAPTIMVNSGPRQEPRQYLEAGKNWQRQPGTHMVDDSIISVIRSTHAQRLASGWPGGTNKLSLLKPPQQPDVDGGPALLARFQHLIGRIE